MVLPNASPEADSTMSSPLAASPTASGAAAPIPEPVVFAELSVVEGGASVLTAPLSIAGAESTLSEP